MICEGGTHDEWLFHVHDKIERYGWSATYVEEGAANPAWAYTIGLSGGFDHPELVVVGLKPDEAATILGEIAHRVIEHAEGFMPTTDDIPASATRFVEVHPSHWSGNTFAAWHNYYSALRRPLPEQSALQVFVAGAPEHPRLDDPTVRLGGPGSNRAVRRATARRRRGPRNHDG